MEGIDQLRISKHPIKLYAATEDKDIKLRSLHKEDHAPIKYEKVCTNCEKTLSPDEIVKGYEYVKGKYVVLTDEDLKSLKQEHEEKAVEIVDFVQLQEIDPIYFNRSYFVGPGIMGRRPIPCCVRRCAQPERSVSPI